MSYNYHLLLPITIIPRLYALLPIITYHKYALPTITLPILTSFIFESTSSIPKLNVSPDYIIILAYNPPFYIPPPLYTIYETNFESVFYVKQTRNKIEL